MKKIQKWNEDFAAWAVDKFNTMACFWIFFLYGLLGAIPKLAPQQPVLLYWSNFVQLIALPLLGVGMVVIERRNKSISEDILSKHNDLHDKQDAQSLLLLEIQDLHKDIKKLLEK